MLGIVGVLDQVQKLFGKSFVIAGFLPSLLFAAAVAALCYGPGSVVSELDALQAKGLAVRGVLVLGVIYLMSYLIYGIRPALHELFRGRLPLFLRPLQVLLRAGERWTRDRRDRRLEERERQLSAYSWPVRAEDAFGEASLLVVLSVREAEGCLGRARAALRSVLRGLREGGRLDRGEIRRFRELILDAHLLKANRDRLPAAVAAEVDELVEEFRDALVAPENHELYGAGKRCNEAAHAAWDEAYADLRRDFPAEPRFVRPTRLGNVAMVQDLYPLKRYGIPLGDLWPRLWPLLPKDQTERIQDANTFLDFTVVMSFYSGLTAVVAGVAAGMADRGGLAGPLLGLVAAVSSCVLFYGLAVEATRGFGLLVQAAVDRYRLDLVDALGYERPADPREERELWERLRRFFSQGDELGPPVRFKGPGAGG